MVSYIIQVIATLNRPRPYKTNKKSSISLECPCKLYAFWEMRHSPFSSFPDLFWYLSEKMREYLLLIEKTPPRSLPIS